MTRTWWWRMKIKTGRAKQWFYSRLSIQILSLIIAVAVWFFVSWDHSSKGYRTMNLPIRVVGAGEALVVSPSATAIEARLFGDMTVLSQLDSGALDCVIDVSGLPQGSYQLTPRIDLPKGVDSVSFRPQFVVVRILKRSSRSLPVRIDFGRDFPNGLNLSTASVNPKRVSVTGTDEELSAVDFARVVVPYEDFASGRRVFPVELIFKEGMKPERDLEVSPREVTLDLMASSDKMVRRVPVKASVEGIPDWGLSVESVKVQPESVLLAGPEEALAKVGEISLPPVNVDGATGDFSSWVPVDPQVEGVSVLGTGLVQVQVRFSKRSSKKVLKGVPVSIRGAEPGRSWSVHPEVVDVTLDVGNADQSTLDGLPSDLVEAYVDASNVVASRISLPVLVKVKRDSISLSSVDPQMVQLVEKR